jgi:hypothetical protein
MPRAYARKSDAYRARLTVPMTERGLERLRRYAVGRGQPMACAARDLIERGLPIETKEAAE